MKKEVNSKRPRVTYILTRRSCVVGKKLDAKILVVNPSASHSKMQQATCVFYTKIYFLGLASHLRLLITFKRKEALPPEQELRGNLRFILDSSYVCNRLHLNW